MKHSFSRLFAVLAAAALCLSAVAMGTAAQADDTDVGYARNGGVVMEDTDPGYAREGGVVVPEPDAGYARNGGVVVPVEPAGAPVTADSGISASTILLLSLTAAAVVVAGVFVVRWRHVHHVAHPA